MTNNTTTLDTGNGETLSTGVFPQADGTFLAMTFTRSKSFKTRRGADAWLARNTPASSSPAVVATVAPVGTTVEAGGLTWTLEVPGGFHASTVDGYTVIVYGGEYVGLDGKPAHSNVQIDVYLPTGSRGCADGRLLACRTIAKSADRARGLVVAAALVAELVADPVEVERRAAELAR